MRIGKYYIAATMVISTIVFWIIFFIVLIYGYVLKKRDPERNMYGKSDLYGTLCFIFNLSGGFVLFELFSFVIAVFAESIPLNIVLHIPAWYISMWAAQWILPHIVNRIVELFIECDE